MTPIVLQHGLFGHGDFRFGPWRLSYFGGIERAIIGRGFPVIVSNVHPTAGVATRARQLKESILSRLAELNRRDEPVVIMAHSMGGLDARYMITHLGMADRVRALVTISSPHRGSAYADWVVTNIGNRYGGLRLMNVFNIDVQAIVDVTRESCRTFNETTPDMPQVRYYSISAESSASDVPAFGRHSHRVIAAAEGANDGLVSVASAMWAEHLETWSADHWLTINSPMSPRRRQTDRIVGAWMRIIDRLLKDGRL
jgi:triacylglycerol lipase